MPTNQTYQILEYNEPQILVIGLNNSKSKLRIIFGWFTNNSMSKDKNGDNIAQLKWWKLTDPLLMSGELQMDEYLPSGSVLREIIDHSCWSAV